MKTLRPAFSIIEILISVIIIMLAIVPVLKIHTSNHEQIVYISERNKRSLEDSLYLSNNILSYHKDNKNAYDILSKFFRIKEFESRDILKKSDRDILIPEQEDILSMEEQAGPSGLSGPSATVNEIILKGKHSSAYYHFSLEGF